MKKVVVAVFSCVFFIPVCRVFAAQIALGEVEYNSPVEQVVVLEPTMRPNKAYHMRCTVSNTGKEPIKVAFNVIGAVPYVPTRYALIPKPFSFLGDEAELESYTTYEWVADPVAVASLVVGRERVSFRVFDPHHLEHLKVTDCYAVSISKA